jgi:hypothetical protein
LCRPYEYGVDAVPRPPSFSVDPQMNLVRRSAPLIAALAVSAVAVPAVRAQLILGTSTSIGSFDSNLQANQWHAYQFAMGSTPFIPTSLQVTLGSNFGSNNPIVTPVIYADNSNAVGSVVATFQSQNVQGVNPAQTYTLSTSSRVPLLANTKYWLAFTMTSDTGGSSPQAGYRAALLSNVTTTGSAAFETINAGTDAVSAVSHDAGQTWSAEPGVSSVPLVLLSGQAVPEASPLMLGGIVSAMVGIRAAWRRRRRTQS